MINPLRKTQPLFKILNSSMIDMPLPSNISVFWNFGSLLALCLGLQIATGMFLAMHFSADISIAYSSIAHICRDVNYGWILRTIHMNGASLFFVCLYIHIGRGIYYNSYMMLHAWAVGVIMLFMVMATAFLGYVLPWGQMSFWGATVITNLFSALPHIGPNLVQWIWGGFAIDNATLTRFYSFHFILPFLIAAATFVHILFLHSSGAKNPLGLISKPDKIPFHPYFTFKDITGFMMMFMFLILLSLTTPYLLSDPDNFIPANPLVTPVHIQPEWYFLFAYAILRSIPSKLGGVIALVMSVAILFMLPFSNFSKFNSLAFYPFNQVIFWSFIVLIILLTWIGARPVEDPYVVTGQILTTLYFAYYIINPLMTMWWDSNLS